MIRTLLVLALCAGVAPIAAADALDTLKSLGRDLGGTPKLLPPEQAFKVAAKVRDAGTLAVEFAPAPAYYLYRKEFRFGLTGAESVGIATVKLPRGEDRVDATFGRVEVYRKPVVAEIGLGREGAAARKVVLEVRYQGCSEKGVCYPPITRRFDLALPAN